MITKDMNVEAYFCIPKIFAVKYFGNNSKQVQRNISVRYTEMSNKIYYTQFEYYYDT